MFFKVLRTTLGASAALLAACSGGGGGSGGNTQISLLTVIPAKIAASEFAQVTWNANAAMRCWATGSWGGDADTSGTVFFQFSRPGKFRFDLTCESYGGRQTKTAVLEVTGDATSLAMRADSTIVPSGQAARITWSSSGRACEASDDWSGAKPASGSETVQISAGYNVFALTCTGPAGTTQDFIVVRGQVTTIDLEAAPDTVGAGLPSTLRWFSWDAESCAASGAWSGSRQRSGLERFVPPAVGDHVLTLTCQGPGGPAVHSVTVSAVLPEVSLRAFPREVAVGGTYTVDWMAREALACAASGAWAGSRANEGQPEQFTADIAGVHEHTLTCSNAGGDTSVTETVTVSAAAAPKATAYQIGPDHNGFVTYPAAPQFPVSHDWRVTFARSVSYPIIADGRVFVTSGHDSMLGGQLHALSLDTGDVLWGPIALGGEWDISHATYEDGRLFVLNSDGLLATFDAATGDPGWTLQLSNAGINCTFDAPPTAMGGIVFAGGCGYLNAVEQATGELLWERPVIGGFASSPAVTPIGVYVVYPYQTYAFSPAFGRALWHIDYGGLGGGGSTAVVAGGVVYAKDDHQPYDSFYFLNQLTGDTLGSLTGTSPPTVTSSQLFIAQEGSLKAFTLSAAPLWSIDAGCFYDIEATPLVINDRVITGCNESIHAVDAATGQIVWTADAGGFIRRSEQQTVGQPFRGFATGEGYLVVPAGNVLTAWKILP